MNDKKLEILNRLVKEGHIDLREALVLLETDEEKVKIPVYQPKKFPEWYTADEPPMLLSDRY